MIWRELIRLRILKMKKDEENEEMQKMQKMQKSGPVHVSDTSRARLEQHYYKTPPPPQTAQKSALLGDESELFVDQRGLRGDRVSVFIYASFITYMYTGKAQSQSSQISESALRTSETVRF